MKISAYTSTTCQPLRKSFCPKIGHIFPTRSEGPRHQCRKTKTTGSFLSSPNHQSDYEPAREEKQGSETTTEKHSWGPEMNAATARLHAKLRETTTNRAGFV